MLWFWGFGVVGFIYLFVVYVEFVFLIWSDYVFVFVFEEYFLSFEGFRFVL